MPTGLGHQHVGSLLLLASRDVGAINRAQARISARSFRRDTALGVGPRRALTAVAPFAAPLPCLQHTLSARCSPPTRRSSEIEYLHIPHVRTLTPILARCSILCPYGTRRENNLAVSRRVFSIFGCMYLPTGMPSLPLCFFDVDILSQLFVLQPFFLPAPPR